MCGFLEAVVIKCAMLNIQSQFFSSEKKTCENIMLGAKEVGKD